MPVFRGYEVPQRIGAAMGSNLGVARGSARKEHDHGVVARNDAGHTLPVQDGKRAGVAHLARVVAMNRLYVSRINPGLNQPVERAFRTVSSGGGVAGAHDEANVAMPKLVQVPRCLGPRLDVVDSCKE